MIVWTQSYHLPPCIHTACLYLDLRDFFQVLWTLNDFWIYSLLIRHITTRPGGGGWVSRLWPPPHPWGPDSFKPARSQHTAPTASPGRWWPCLSRSTSRRWRGTGSRTVGQSPPSAKPAPKHILFFNHHGYHLHENGLCIQFLSRLFCIDAFFSKAFFNTLLKAILNSFFYREFAKSFRKTS